MAYLSKEEYRSSGGEVSSSSYSVDATRVHDSKTKLWVEPLGSILDKEYPKPEPLIEGLLHSGTQTIIMVEQVQVRVISPKKSVLVWLARLTSGITKSLRQSRFYTLTGRCSQQICNHVISK